MTFNQSIGMGGAQSRCLRRTPLPPHTNWRAYRSLPRHPRPLRVKRRLVHHRARPACGSDQARWRATLQDLIFVVRSATIVRVTSRVDRPLRRPLSSSLRRFGGSIANSNACPEESRLRRARKTDSRARGSLLRHRSRAPATHRQSSAAPRVRTALKSCLTNRV